MICLDSTFLIDLFNEEKKAVQKYNEIKSELLVVTPINVYEVFFGLFSNKISQEIREAKLKRATEFFESITVLPLNTSPSIEAAKIAKHLEEAGESIGDFDSIILGIMKTNGCNKIMTNNTKHFSKLKDLEFINY